LSPVKLANRLGRNKTELALLEQRHLNAVRSVSEAKANSLGFLAAKLDSLSPLSVLDRGYSITTKENGLIVRDASQVAEGDKLKIRLARGKLEAEVLSSES